MQQDAASSPAAAAAASASASPSWGGGFSGSGAAGAGSDLRGAVGFSALDAALGAGAPVLALASMDSGTEVWSGQQESL